MKIVVDDLSGSQIAQFLEAHVVEMRSITPREYAHALELDALRESGVMFWSMWDGDTVVGCAAIKRLDSGHAELKSMRTAPGRRRGGVASMLLRHIITEARRMGYSQLSLETGTEEFFSPARRLYEKFGFTSCEPFADYQASPHNTFMTRAL
jgi:putative acetyltransferase